MPGYFFCEFVKICRDVSPQGGSAEYVGVASISVNFRDVSLQGES